MPKPSNDNTLSAERLDFGRHERLALFPLAGPRQRPISLGEREICIGREPRDEHGVTIADPRLSRRHARLVRLAPSVYRVEDCESKNGTWHNGVPASGLVLDDQDVLRLGDCVFVAALEAPSTDEPGISVPGPEPSAEERAKERRARATLIGHALVIEELRQRLLRIAPTTATALILGETGTGKEVCARLLHELSGRAGAFVAVNCGAIPADLIERELFGHVRGAFTGADRAGAGYLQAAEHGTLFLDEIGELPATAQSKLLRLLEDYTFRRVGSPDEQRADVRVIAATNRSLDERVAAGAFREDLLARLDEVQLRLPPLRQRKEDLMLLADALLQRDGRSDLGFSADAVEALALYGWPRNVRELAKRLRAVALELSRGESIGVSRLPDALKQPLLARSASATSERPQKSELVQLLRTHRGVVARIAEIYGVDRKQVYRWVQYFQIDVEAFRR